MPTQKNILITGGTAGIGQALVEYFDQRDDYQVYFTARSESKAQTLMQTLKKSKYFLIDFANFKTIVEGVKQIQNQLSHLDILINNAGTWQMEFRETYDGIEMNFAVNHLAPMLLTLELLPLLNKASAARIINTSSGAHRRNILNLEDIEFRNQEYNGIATYSQSKLCNLLFSQALQQKLVDTPTTVNTVHPGYVQSNLFENMQPRNWESVPSSEQGARSAIYVATDPELKGISGRYFYLEQEEPRRSTLATDSELADQLWTLSMSYIKDFLTH